MRPPRCRPFVPDLAVWSVANGSPRRIPLESPKLEADLEAWIEKDPTLVARGLTIVGRQFQTEAGPIDLLAIDPQGAWVVVEIKRDAIRRDAIAQAIDYASCIDRVDSARLAAAAQRAGASPGSPRERDVRIILVGTSRDPGMERMVEYMAEKFDFPIRIVTFSHIRDGDGQYLLREITEADVLPHGKGGPASPRPRLSIDDARKVAETNGVLPIVDAFLDAAKEIGLSPQPYSKSIMIAPPWNRNRMVFTVSTERWREGRGRVYLSPDTLVEFASVDPDDAERVATTDGWRYVTAAEAVAVASDLSRLLVGRLRANSPPP